MANVLVPISIGELVDKITILRIKKKMISDAGKLENIKKEYEALSSVAVDSGIDLDSDAVSSLEAINFKLWNIEDDIRQKERARKFDEEFIELARSVYVVNDQRFEAKSKVNKIYGSNLKEEKSYEDYS
jgi:hypothetical protein